MSDQEQPMSLKKPLRADCRGARSRHRKRIQEALHWLAAKGLIYDTGERRKGQIVWRLTPGKAAKARTLLDVADGSEE